MANVPLTTVAICSVSEPGEEAQALLRDDIAPREYLALLMQKDLFPDAVRFLAHALPKREGVWWAWVCARRSAGTEPSQKVKASLDATEKWIAQPSDENRRAAMRAAEAAEFKTAAGCAGMAAFFSGGSLAPPDLAPVPPAEHLSGQAVANAVTLAALLPEPEKAPEKYRAFLQQGIDVVNRIKLW
jgi:hypothetical protein